MIPLFPKDTKQFSASPSIPALRNGADSEDSDGYHSIEREMTGDAEAHAPSPTHKGLLANESGAPTHDM